ncbi:hypothetical protein BpHYR1_034053 [Brachionus plicatilis]|uniref:Uncharacterized protein n=1 Tax=Brachionus plicatilis TaxID=10195 RepID=A0A3M7PLT8_BRAPC|nr:hypothetical protein BpHYR1_034053 [Brachionus plicatilis]
MLQIDIIFTNRRILSNYGIIKQTIKEEKKLTEKKFLMIFLQKKIKKSISKINQSYAFRSIILIKLMPRENKCLLDDGRKVIKKNV